MCIAHLIANKSNFLLRALSLIKFKGKIPHITQSYHPWYKFLTSLATHCAILTIFSVRSKLHHMTYTVECDLKSAVGRLHNDNANWTAANDVGESTSSTRIKRDQHPFNRLLSWGWSRQHSQSLSWLKKEIISWPLCPRFNSVQIIFFWDCLHSVKQDR